MRRSLVLTDETAGHPFRASLPPHVLSEEEPVRLRKPWHLSRSDLRGFFAAYCGCLVAALIFFA